MVKVICSRSGLLFDADSKRQRVHPKIGYYTSHKNTEIRYPAIKVIEQGKAEGWDNLDQFLEAIEEALNPLPIPSYNFKGDWVAEITGSDAKFRFNRKFLTAVYKEGRFKYFNIKDDGIYETCYKSAKGNQDRQFIEILEDKISPISLEEVEKRFPKIDLDSNLDFNPFENCLKVDKNLGSEGDRIIYQNKNYEIAYCRIVEHWENEDGISGTGLYNPHAFNGAELLWERAEIITYLKEVE